ncbi:MAG: hypothetical protein AAFO03_20680 [Bacteroidota bacterium]
MELLLHIGTEKTGSSFIQTSLAVNRDELLSNGIWYPTAGVREQDMLAGRISPGNALPLYQALRDGNLEQAEAVLKTFHQAATERGVKAILLSNENLIEPLSDVRVFETFGHLLSAIDLQLKSVLLVLRDPVEQALSLYKHRAKNGGIPRLDDWLQGGFKLGEHLLAFQSVMEASVTNVQVKRYTKDSSRILSFFYSEWLGLEVPANIQHKEVNPSLTLSELELLNKIHEENPVLAQSFYKAMLEVPVQDKSRDEYLAAHVRETIANELAAKASIWEYYNCLLSSTDQLQIPQVVAEVDAVKERYSFSEIQLNTIAQFMHVSTTRAAMIRRSTEWMKRIYGRLRSSWGGKQKS